MVRTKYSLCGSWQYTVNGGTPCVKEVPFSSLCVGESVCRKVFAVAPADGRMLLAHLRIELADTDNDLLLYGVALRR